MKESLRRRLKGTVVFVILILCCSRCFSVSGEDIGFGQPITIVEKGGEYSNSGEFILTVDGVHICRGVSEYLYNGMNALGIQCVIENVSYKDWFDESEGMDAYDVSQHVQVIDSEGFNCEFYYLQDSTGDGKYAIGAKVRRGSKARESMIYLVDPDMKEFEIRIDEYRFHCRLNDQGVGELVGEDGSADHGADASAVSADGSAPSADTSKGNPEEAGNKTAEAAAPAEDQNAVTERLDNLEKKVLELEERIGAIETINADLENRISALEAAGQTDSVPEEAAAFSEETVRKYETALTGYFKLLNELKTPGDLVVCDVVYYPPKNMVIFEYTTERTYDDYVEYAAYMEGERDIDTYYAEGYYKKPACEHLDWDDIMRYNDTERG